jgi:hypothetical protein
MTVNAAKENFITKEIQTDPSSCELIGYPNERIARACSSFNSDKIKVLVVDSMGNYLGQLHTVRYDEAANTVWASFELNGFCKKLIDAGYIKGWEFAMKYLSVEIDIEETAGNYYMDYFDRVTFTANSTSRDINMKEIFEQGESNG